MYRSLALRLSSNISRPACLHSNMLVHLMTRKFIDKKQTFVSSHQLLQKQKECLIPNKDLSQEIGEGIHDVTKAKWVTAAKEFCKKIGISYEQFFFMYRRCPLLKYVESIEHLSQIADVLNEYSYGPVIKHLMVDSVRRLSITNVESLRSALEEHGRDILEVELQSSNVQQTEYMNLKLQYPLTAKAIEYFVKQTPRAQDNFPWQKLTEKSKPYSNIAEFLGDELGIDQRVVVTLWPDNLHRPGVFWKHRTRVVLLQKEGFETRDIFENLSIVTDGGSNLGFVKTIEEMVKVGERTLYEYNPLGTKLMTTRTLSRLFKTTCEEMSKSEIEYFHGKSRTNAATVFFLLTDAGFHMEEIREYIFLLGVPENEIRNYLKDYNMKSLAIKNERWKILYNMHEDLLLAQEDQDELY